MRRTGIVLFLCSLLIVASRSLATDHQKLSGYVKSLLPASQPAAGRSLTPAPTASRTLTAFLKVDAACADTVYKTYGLRCYAQQGDIAIVGIPVDCLAALSEHPAVHRIEASPSASLTMDTTAIIVGADKVYSSLQPLPGQSNSLHSLSPFTGQGVVVGIMDVGFDLTHPNFYDATMSQYRIGAFWDQLSLDTIGSTMPVGRDFIGTEAVLAQQHSRDGLIQTHGTHTLGIAAGSGYLSPYRGIAYDAELCLVSNAVNDDIELIDSADYYKYTTATDALGFKYMFDYADRQGKPCVASFSEGYSPYMDEDDSLFAAFLDSLTTVPGHIIVASAGNENNTVYTYFEKAADMPAAGAFLLCNKKHASYRLQTEGPADIHLLAYDKQDPDIPRDTLTFRFHSLTQDFLLTDTLFLNGDTCVARLDCYPSAFTAATVCYLQLSASQNLSALSSHLALVVEGDTHAEVFGSSSSSMCSQAIDSRWNAGQQGHNIVAPGCFPAVICAGSTTHRQHFINAQGIGRNVASGPTVGQRSYYSSTGPTMNALTKPDVMAPGDNIISSYSSYYTEAHPDTSNTVVSFDFNGRSYPWAANSGTSMACPVAAGVIALWLQAKPDLTRNEIIEVLSRTCRHPVSTLTYPNNEYGFGEIDAYRGLLDILGIDRIEGISLHQPERLRLAMYGSQLLLKTTEHPAVPLRISIYSLNGTLVHQTTLQPTDTSIPLPSLPRGLYAVQVTCSDPRFTGSQLVNQHYQ